MEVYAESIKSFRPSVDLYNLLEIIPRIPIHLRKVTMTFCRVQQSPYRHPTLKSLLKIHGPYLITLDSFTEYLRPLRSYSPDNLTFQNLVAHPFRSIYSDPIGCSILSMYLRMAPIEDDAGMQDMLVESIMKEISANAGRDRPQEFDYRTCFGNGLDDIRRPLSANTPPRPNISAEYTSRFRKWRRSMEGRVLYPQSSNNTTSMSSQDEMHYIIYNSARITSSFLRTTKDAEYIYHHYGFEGFTGACEMRLAFKHNDVKPRIYYCMGTLGWKYSRYIHKIVDSIMKLFPHTSPATRFDVTRIEIDTENLSYVMIYDYSTFTSNLSELKYFLRSLADFCKGIFGCMNERTCLIPFRYNSNALRCQCRLHRL